MVDKFLRSEDYTEEQLLEEIHKSLEGNLNIGRRVAGRKIFFTGPNNSYPRHDVLFFWRSMYIRCSDEYEFAIKVFNDWSVYKRFYNNCRPYRDYFLPLWDEEREMRIRSYGMKNILEDIKGGNIKTSQWLEKHLTTSASDKEPVKKKKAQAKELVDELQSEDQDLFDTIENAYKNLN